MCELYFNKNEKSWSFIYSWKLVLFIKFDLELIEEVVRGNGFGVGSNIFGRYELVV